MEVFVVLEVVDLGDHIHSIHFKEEDAKRIAEQLQAEMAAKYRADGRYYYYIAQDVV